MLIRTVKTYCTLIFGLIFKYRHTKIAAKIREEKSVREGDEYGALKAAEIIKDTFKVADTQIIVDGFENIPKDRTFVIFANHKSMVDVLAIYATVNQPISFIGKIELKKVPVLRGWMEAMGAIFMDRSDLRESMKALMEGIKKVKAGTNMGIFPEGTRSSGRMNEFKGGSFKLATKCGAPIVPVSIEGTNEMFEDNHMFVKKATIKITYHPVVETEGLSKEEEKELPAKVQEIIGSALKEEHRYVKNENIDC